MDGSRLHTHSHLGRQGSLMQLEDVLNSEQLALFGFVPLHTLEVPVKALELDDYNR